ncbi:MAG: glycoside hydrolase family 3 N-terminal domain-containing protein [Gemmatimonadales bacterium]
MSTGALHGQANSSPSSNARTPEARLEERLASLTIRQKAAQVVVPWLSGSYAAFDAEALEQARLWVDSLEVGGLIISIGSPLDIASKLNYLQLRSRLPLLIAADLEAGTAIRLLGGTPFPRNMGVAAAGSELDAYQVGRISALEGRAVGIHMAYAPVADVNNNPDNPIINVRSFGEDPYQVARLVSAEIRGMQDHGLLATAKHFPGHGDTGTDSHLALPVISAGWDRLDSLELVPFRAAIDVGVTAVMSAHIALPSFNGSSSTPATLAPDILTGVLRDSLGFDGIIVTDALNMAGVVQAYGEGESAVLAFLAGADLLLQPGDPAVAIDAVVQAVEQGRITTERLDQSVRQMLALKQRQGLFHTRTVSLESIPNVVGSAAFEAIARDITRRSLVLLKDSTGLVRALPQARQVSIVNVSKEGQRSLGNTLAAKLREAGMEVESFRLYPASGPASYDSARAVIRQSPVTVFMTAVRPVSGEGVIDMPEAAVELIETTAQWNPTVLVSLGSPYVIRQVSGVWSYILGWVNRRMTEEELAAAMLGLTSFTGTSPISIPPDYPMGSGITPIRP